jgi:hypothetical protein
MESGTQPGLPLDGDPDVWLINLDTGWVFDGVCRGLKICVG